MRTGLRYAAVLAAVIAISSTSLGEVTGTAFAVPCQRTVGVEPQVSIGEGGGMLLFAVFTGGCTPAGGVGYTIAEGSAEDGEDFKQQTGRLHWNAGQTGPKTISVPILQDEDVEPDLENFWVHLIEPDSSVAIAGASGEGRVLDDDRPGFLIAVDDRSCLAAMPDPRCLCPDQFQVFQLMPYVPNCGSPELHMSAPQVRPTTVHWHTKDGTAIAGRDYEPVNDGVTRIRIGETTADLNIRLVPRPGAPSRYLTVEIDGVSWMGRVVDGSAMIIIHGT